MNQAERILSFCNNLLEMKIGIGFIFGLRGEGGRGADYICYCQFYR